MFYINDKKNIIKKKNLAFILINYNHIIKSQKLNI